MHLRFCLVFAAHHGEAQIISNGKSLIEGLKVFFPFDFCPLPVLGAQQPQLNNTQPLQPYGLTEAGQVRQVGP